MTTDSHVSGSSYETAKKIAPLDQGIILRKEKNNMKKKEMRMISTVERRTTGRNRTCLRHCLSVANIGSDSRPISFLCMCPT